jgi:hypothetical protein
MHGRLRGKADKPDLEIDLQAKPQKKSAVFLDILTTHRFRFDSLQRGFDAPVSQRTGKPKSLAYGKIFSEEKTQVK